MTTLLYLSDMQTLEGAATVGDVRDVDGRTGIVLDRTLFYPQGGGQPADRGVIESDSARFDVDSVRSIEDAVLHFGTFSSGSFARGSEVRMRVDGDRRRLNSRIHSAGHVVDLAVASVGLDWVPGKGYHFPDGPYVEYAGTIEGDRDALRQKIEAECNRVVSEGAETRVVFATRDEIAKICRFVPDYVPAEGESRVVMYGDFGVPCGGTHVANLREIGSITIRKMKPSGATIRVAYAVT